MKIRRKWMRRRRIGGDASVDEGVERVGWGMRNANEGTDRGMRRTRRTEGEGDRGDGGGDDEGVRVMDWRGCDEVTRRFVQGTKKILVEIYQ